jgi:hypothetical protein
MHDTHEYPTKAVDARAMRHGPMVARMLCGIVLIGWETLGLAMAGEELGQFCWRLSPYVDTVRLSVSVINGDVQMFHVLADWRAGPAPANQTRAYTK